MRGLASSAQTVVLLGVLLVSSQLSAAASTTPSGWQRCDPETNVCTVIVKRPGSRHTSSKAPSDRPSKTLGPTRNHVPQPNSCRTRAAVPQPPKSDPVWEGHTTGVILVYSCWLLLQMDSHWVWSPTADSGAVAEPVISPGELARRALAELRIPEPVIFRSPAQSNGAGGIPVTWANLWTWVWTSPASWAEHFKKASVGDVWARVMVSPVALIFRPDVGSVAVSCDGPGRAWTPEDGDAAPTRGGCGYMYRSVNSAVTSSLSIRWRVSWTGSDGSSGQLPAMTTTTTSRFAVEQIQGVNR